MSKLIVNIKQQEINYPIYITNNDLTDLKAEIMEKVGLKNYIVVISQKVYKLYSKILNLPKEKVFILRDGEVEKNFDNYRKILNFALKNKLKREDTIIAIGGGVVGDITGFVAATYMRGINFIQIPTTLLAATDSSVGGKVAIDTKYGKNLVGAFYQPKAVFINVNFIKTLDDKQYLSGLGEVLKYGFIEKSCNPDLEPHLINFLREYQEKIISKDTSILKELIKMCVELKRAVVEKDEKENNLRRILNYGHTYAHAVETITQYQKFTHGQCVIEGIMFVLNIAQQLNLIDKEYKFICEDLIKKYNYEPLVKFKKEKIVDIMLSDKKATNEYIKFILPNGFATVTEHDFTKEEVLNYL